HVLPPRPVCADGPMTERIEQIEVGLRGDRRLADDTPLPESDTRLVAHIRDEIGARGPMTFARFMELALYDPDAGYYATGAGGPGRAGDFLTAPEAHPIFGWAIARRLEQAWDQLSRPDPFVVREHGSGAGGLAVGILGGLRRAGSPLLDAIRYQPIDISAAARAAFSAAVEAAGVAAHVVPPDDRLGPGAVIANELLDALPVHLVEGGPSGNLLERFVGIGPAGGLAAIAAPPSTPALAARLAAEGIALQPGQRAEVCLEIDTWLAAAVAPLERGLVIVVDYGQPADQLYAPGRGSTLRAYHRHRVHDDPLVAIGRQDLTAHVDLTALERAGAAAGLAVLRRTTQAEYLADLGLGELLVGLQSGPDASFEAYLAARSAVVRLLDPRATGRFAVIELGRGLPPLAGGAARTGRAVLAAAREGRSR
ncbi:MAG TPA: SAM-dependent methyltransferase, partial [Candidatus Binatus sp.]|nr:SAM-dependent methyltransferase [Candidatus Binatus sp.]